MSNPRRQFLSRFFGDLEQNGIRYCIQRNYDNLYDNDLATDLDMIVSEYSRGRFEQCLQEAAARTGFRFVHQARYVNYSQVFWHPTAGFVRVDFETDVRWRLFTVLNAREVLDARLRHENFFATYLDSERHFPPIAGRSFPLHSATPFVEMESIQNRFDVLFRAWKIDVRLEGIGPECPCVVSSRPSLRAACAAATRSI